MGTNFYLLYFGGRDHIGKRSAAGHYCWDCDITLCKGGNSMVHMGKWNNHDEEWYSECPKCGSSRKEESLDNSSAGRELGFNKEKPKRKSGVQSCSSFTWAVEPGEVATLHKDFKIQDEYGQEYSEEEFKQMLEECPIRFYDSIGQEFC